MEKTLTISGKPTVFKCTGGFLLRYRELTGRDPIRDVAGMEELSGKGKDIDISSLSTDDLMLLYNIVWVMAKTANPDLPDMLDWVDSHDEFPIADIFTDLTDLVAKAFQSNLTMRFSKKKPIANQKMKK